MVTAFRPTRLLAYWLLLYVILYVTSFFLFSYYVATASPASAAAAQLVGPIVYFGVAWMYYRRAKVADWHLRLVTVAAWIFLSVSASAFITIVLYHQEWSIIFNVPFWQAQLLNAAAMLAASYVARRPPSPVANP